MKYLLDTNILIYLLLDTSELSEAQSNILATQGTNKFYVSMASIWEMAVKVRIKKLDLKIDFSKLHEAIEKLEVNVLNDKPAHFVKASSLEWYKDHGDPFDQLIISQALIEKMPVLTSDKKFSRYAGLTAIL